MSSFDQSSHNLPLADTEARAAIEHQATAFQDFHNLTSTAIPPEGHQAANTLLASHGVVPSEVSAYNSCLMSGREISSIAQFAKDVPLEFNVADPQSDSRRYLYLPSKGKDGKVLFATITDTETGEVLHPRLRSTNTGKNEVIWAVPFSRQGHTDATSIIITSKPLDALALATTPIAKGAKTIALIDDLCLGQHVAGYGYSARLEQNLTWILPTLRKSKSVGLVPDDSMGIVACDRLAQWLTSRGVRANVITPDYPKIVIPKPENEEITNESGTTENGSHSEFHKGDSTESAGGSAHDERGRSPVPEKSEGEPTKDIPLDGGARSADHGEQSSRGEGHGPVPGATPIGDGSSLRPADSTDPGTVPAIGDGGGSRDGIPSLPTRGLDGERSSNTADSDGQVAKNPLEIARRDAAAWLYIKHLVTGDIDALNIPIEDRIDARLRHDRSSTTWDLDAWLRERHCLTADTARSVSSDLPKEISQWPDKFGPEPKPTDYPELGAKGAAYHVAAYYAATDIPRKSYPASVGMRIVTDANRITLGAVALPYDQTEKEALRVASELTKCAIAKWPNACLATSPIAFTSETGSPCLVASAHGDAIARCDSEVGRSIILSYRNGSTSPAQPQADKPAIDPTPTTSATKADEVAKPVKNDKPGIETKDLPAVPQAQVLGSAFGLDMTTDPSGIMTRVRANIEALRLSKILASEGREATGDEKTKLSKFSGWGAMPSLFARNPPSDDKFSDERSQLTALLTADQMTQAAESTINSHYTSREIVATMWSIATRIGFTGGRFLETSSGIGRILGLMPDDLKNRTSVVAVEMDETVGTMLKQIYSKADVRIQPFQQFAMPDGFFDLASSNVPFAEFAVREDAKYRKLGPVLHDYCIVKGMDKVRPGGFGIWITSTGTLDKSDQRVRQHLADSCDLVAAMRLPDGTFKDAGTAVVTDLLVLRRRAPGEESNGIRWVEAKEVQVKGVMTPLNEYYVANPEQILGILDTESRLYRADASHVTMTSDFRDRLAAAVERIPANIYTDRAAAAADAATSALEAQRLEEASRLSGVGNHLKPGSYTTVEGKVYRRDLLSDDLLLLQPDPRSKEETDKGYQRRITAHEKMVDVIRYAIPVREAVVACLNSQTNITSTEQRDMARRNLLSAYDAFVQKHGFLSTPSNARCFSADPEASLLLALEILNDEGDVIGKAPIFTVDTIRPRNYIDRCDSLRDAIGCTLNEVGYLAPSLVASKLGITPEEAMLALRFEGAAFETPSGSWITSDEYLSGSVRKKLVDAKAAAAIDPRFEVNVQALEKVIPADIDYTDIEVHAGAPWIPASDYVAFAMHCIGGHEADFRIDYLASNGEWVIGVTKSGRNLPDNHPSTKIWGTKRANYIECLRSAMTGSSITIWNEDENGSRAVNTEETAAANAKVVAIKDEFKDWVWADSERRTRLHRTYNDTFNDLVLRSYDGSHLTFPGMTPTISMREHQKDAVWRSIVRRRALYGHEVGTGKTFTLGATAMEFRRLGIANKPAIICLKANIGQVTADIQRLYPAARIISAYEDFDAKSRMDTVARIATGDWDLVVLTHDQLGKIPVSPALRGAYIQEQLWELEELLNAEIEEEGLDKSILDNEKEFKKAGRHNLTLKRLQKMRLKLKDDLSVILDDAKKDDGATYEQTGIDAILVDEAHIFKSLPIKTRMGNVKGVPTGDSQRATNLDMIIRYQSENKNGGGVVFATGTPVVNTLAEVFIMQQYIQRNELVDRNINNFDAWCKTYCSTSTRMEFTHAGDYKPVTRLREFTNLPELRNLAFLDFDVVAADSVNEINRPHRHDIAVALEPSPSQSDYMQEIRKRAKDLESGLVKDRTIDNHLKISTDGRLMSLDIRMVDSPSEQEIAEYGTKTIKCAKQCLAILADHPGSTQMIFTDTHKSSKTHFNVVTDIINSLVEGGIPRNKIVLFSGLSDAERLSASQRLNTGEIIIGIGSTETMGTGINAQRHLKAVHHLDAPWTPAEVDQRNGRAIRFGNTNKDVAVYTYITKESLDSWFWQTVDRKDRFIKTFMLGNNLGRSMKEESADSLSYEEVMAAASGNPLLFERMNVQNDVDDLTKAQKRHSKSIVQYQNDLEGMERTLVILRAQVDSLTKDIDAITSHSGDSAIFSYKSAVTGEIIDNPIEAGKEIVKIYSNLRPQYGRTHPDLTEFGSYKGMTIYGYKNEVYDYEAGATRTRTGLHATRESSTSDIIEPKKYPLDEWRIKSHEKEEDYAKILSHLDSDITGYHARSALVQVNGTIKQTLRNIEGLKEQISRPFRHADNLANLQHQLRRIEDALAHGLTALPDENQDAATDPIAPATSSN